MIFSVIHATARPYGWQGVYANYCRNARLPKGTTEYILVIDRADVEKFKPVWPPEDKIRVEINDGRQCYIDAANHGAKMAEGEIFVMASDDMPVVSAGWDAALKERWEDFSRYSSVAWVNCNYRADIMCSQVMAKGYYRRYGFVFDPAFASMHGDDDLTARAERDGVIIDCRADPRLQWNHLSHYRGLREPDEVDLKNASPERYAEGLAAFVAKWGAEPKQVLNYWKEKAA